MGEGEDLRRKVDGVAWKQVPILRKRVDFPAKLHASLAQLFALPYLRRPCPCPPESARKYIRPWRFDTFYIVRLGQRGPHISFFVFDIMYRQLHS